MESHSALYKDIRRQLLQPLLFLSLIGVVAFLFLASLKLIVPPLFPFDGLTMLFTMGLLLYFVQHGHTDQVAKWFISALIFFVTLNMQHFGVRNSVTVLYIPCIVVSGLLFGRMFQGYMFLLCATFVVLVASAELFGLNTPLDPIRTMPEWTSEVLFWLFVFSLTTGLVWLFAYMLERHAMTLRAQTVALKNTINLLQKQNNQINIIAYLEQFLWTIAEQLETPLATIFIREPEDESLVPKLSYQHGVIVDEEQFHNNYTLISIAPTSRLWQDLLRDKKTIVISNVANDSRLTVRAHLIAGQIQSILAVPMLESDEIIGALVIGSHKRNAYNSEQIEIVQALTQQITLLLHLSKLTRAVQQGAVASERNRMAREIHDTLAQGFIGIIVQIEAALDVATDSIEAACKHLVLARRLAKESLTEARRSVWELRSVSLEGHSLPDALKGTLDYLSKNTELQASFDIQGVPRDLPADIEINLLRIGQEAVTNALKYAQAHSVEMQLSYKPDAVVFHFADDGVGFDIENVRPGFGLIGMRERAKIINAELDVYSQKDNGTSITVIVQNKIDEAAG